VGSCVLNRDGLVFIGRRIDGPEHVDAVHAWQMPQGGVDPGEDPWPAALRELYEETNIRSVEKLGEIDEWLCYDIPRKLVGGRGRVDIAANARVVRAGFTGDEREIDVAHPAGGRAKFVECRWER
jgi:putative (di)nucleoside polyphosphate hydrolase